MTEHFSPNGDRVPDRTALAEWPSIPGYRILSELGRGGMGLVYKATQLNSGKIVALKIIRSGNLASPHELARMRIEAEAVSRLQHPNIVQVLEIGEVYGHPFLAMEYIPGSSLDKQLISRPLTQSQAVEMIRTLAHAIQHSHEQKVIHRDLKPANILIRNGYEKIANDETLIVGLPPGDALEPELEPVVTDFGLAKRLDSETTALTYAGAILGTASYMAPEQATGNGEIGPAVDIYALGVILYELLAGRPPFRASTWTGTIEQLLHDDPPRFKSLGIVVSNDLEAVCMKCLEKTPDRRYATAAELACDLERILNGHAISLDPSTEAELVARYAARDGYTILEKLAHGPHSTVYRATSGVLQAPVTLKVYTRDLWTESEWNDRLQEGTRLWSALNHPQVTVPKQAGWWNGIPFLVTECAPHENLQTSLLTHNYSIHAALRLVEQLTEIICYMHRQGVVHGNLKASNVLIAADGIPRVIDVWALSGLSFGVASVAPDSLSGIAYLAPELFDHSKVELRPFTDVYSIGAILYGLLAGRPPFLADRVEDLLDQVRSSQPPPLATFNNQVSPRLDSFCQRCLRKSPWARFARAYDVLLRVRSFLSEFDDSMPSLRRNRNPR